MAVSNVSVCNKALILLGEDIISSLSDDTKAAIQCGNIYEHTRDAMLRKHPWNFAVKRVALSQSTTAPVWGFDYSYTLPVDCLRVLFVENEDIYPFKLEGRFVVTDNGSDSSTINIKYISRIIDPSQWDTLFVDLLSSRLAYELAIPLTDLKQRRDDMKDLYLERLADVQAVDAQEETSDQVPDGSWADSRLIGTN